MKTYLTGVAAQALADSKVISEPDLQALDDERMFNAFFDVESNDEGLRKIAAMQPDSAVMAACVHSFGAAVMFIHEQDACGVDFEQWDSPEIFKVLRQMTRIDAYERGLGLIGVGLESPNKRVIDNILVRVVQAYNEKAVDPYDFSNDDFKILCRVCFNVGVTFVYNRHHRFADLEEAPRSASVGAPLECEWGLMRKFGEIAERYFKHAESGRSQFLNEFADLAKQGCTEAWNMCGHIAGADIGDFDQAARYYKRAADEGSGLGSWELASSEIELDHVIEAAQRGVPIAMEFLSRRLFKEDKPYLALYWHHLALLCGLELEKDNTGELVKAVRANPISFVESGFAEMGLNEADFRAVTLGSDDQVFSTDDLIALAKKGSQLAALQAADVFESQNRFDDANKMLEDVKATVARPLPMLLRNLGDNYYRGLGGPERRDEAKELWYRAAMREESACMFTMSLLIRKNDPMAANYWLVGSYLRGHKQAFPAIREIFGADA